MISFSISDLVIPKPTASQEVCQTFFNLFVKP